MTTSDTLFPLILKYIYFITSFDVSNDAIANLIQGDSEKYMVFYKVQKGDNN